MSDLDEELGLSVLETRDKEKIEKEVRQKSSGMQLKPPMGGYVNIRNPPKHMLEAVDKFLKHRDPWDEVKVRK